MSGKNIRLDGRGTPLTLDYNVDAFHRYRISQPDTVFDDQPFGGKNDGISGHAFWNYIESGGVSTYKPDESIVELTVGTASGQMVRKRTQRYYQYTPGKSQSIIMTGVMPGSGNPAVETRVGLFDDNNGVFWGVISGGPVVGIRNGGSGSMQETIIPQDSWNTYKYDGSEPYGKQLDIMRAQIFEIDFQWLGVGAVRFGLDIDGDPVTAHKEGFANVTSSTWMGRSQLPLTYEIKNIATSTESSTFKTVCAVLIAEGGALTQGPTANVSRGRELRTEVLSLPVPILAVTTVSCFNNGPYFKSLFMAGVQAYAEDQAVHIEVRKVTDPSTIHGGSFTHLDSGESGVLVNTNPSSVEGGVEQTILDFFLPVARQGTGFPAAIRRGTEGFRDPCLFVPGSNQYFILYAQSIPGTAAKVSGSMDVEEI